jgi:hypothetical protein
MEDGSGETDGAPASTGRPTFGGVPPSKSFGRPVVASGSVTVPPYDEQVRTLHDAFHAPCPAPRLVPGLLPRGSLSIWYGSPGHLKSLLLMDLCMAVATGTNWLPNENGERAGWPVNQAPVLWVDIDNGLEVMVERLAAIGRKYGADETTPIHWITFPDPPFVAAQGLAALVTLAKAKSAMLVVVDNLLRIAGVKDENASEMDNAMKGCRKLAEATGAAVCLIHHRRKDTTGTAADSLRGHSSILASVDAAFLIERHGDSVTVTNTKARRMEVEPFSARWVPTVRPDENLDKARFYGIPLRTGRGPSDDELREGILNALANCPLCAGELQKAVPGRNLDVNRVRDELVREGVVVQEDGTGNRKRFRRVR